MGIIQKQALRTTLINFTGAIFGGFTRILMPVVISPVQIGILGLLDMISGSFVTVFSLGFEQILAKMFPDFRDEKNGHHGFLIFGILLSLLGISIAFVLFYFFEDSFLGDDEASNIWFKTFSYLVFPLIFFRIIFRNLDGYARMLFNSVIGIFLESFLSKIILVSGMIALYLSWIDFDYLVYIYALNFCIPGLVITIFSLRKTKVITWPHGDLIAKKNQKNIREYVFYGILLGTSGTVIYYIDGLMVQKMISFEALGIYSTFFFAARLLVIPSRGINRISVVVLAESWKSDDRKNILEVYKKSCLNQLLMGTFIFGIGWACISSGLELSPKYNLFSDHVYVFFFLGLGLLFEMATGVNSAIITTSKKYKYNTYFDIGLAVAVIILNYFLIGIYQIEGAAIASMLAMILINILRWVFLLKVYQFQPFDMRFAKALLFCLGFILLAHFIDYEASPIIKILLNGIGLTIVFWVSVIAFNLSPDMNQWLMKIKGKFIK